MTATSMMSEQASHDLPTRCRTIAINFNATYASQRPSFEILVSLATTTAAATRSAVVISGREQEGGQERKRELELERELEWERDWERDRDRDRDQERVSGPNTGECVAKRFLFWERVQLGNWRGILSE